MTTKTQLSQAQQDLNDWIAAVRIGARLRNFELIDGALKAFNEPSFTALVVSADHDASEFQQYLDDLVYATSVRDWGQIRQVADRLDGQFTTIAR